MKEYLGADANDKSGVPQDSIGAADPLILRLTLSAPLMQHRLPIEWNRISI